MLTLFTRRVLPVLLGLVIFPNTTFGQQQVETLLYYGCTGSETAGPSCPKFREVIGHREVQMALLQVAAQPRSLEFVDEALRGAGVTASALEALHLIRRDGYRYVLRFWLYTRADLDKLRAVAEVEGRSLAAAFLAHRAEITEMLRRDPLAGVDWKTMAYFLVGCVSLDWDGLNLTVEQGYRTEGPYLPEARQPGGGGSLQGLYWGSRNWHEPVAMTSFGDHYSGPRHALPNLLDSLSLNAPEPLKSAVTGVAAMLIRRQVGTIMLALRDGDKDRSHLAAVAGLADEDADAVLKFLMQLNYVSTDGTRYRAIIPVLTQRDAPMVEDLRRLGRDVMVQWLAKRHEALQQQLADLTPLRNGVPLADGFYWIWHYLFRVANRELVAAGLLADPYAPDRAFKGFIPAVYQLNVVMGPM